MDSDEVSTDVQRIVEIHKRTVSSEDPKWERIKFRMHRSTSIDSSSSSAYDVANRKRKYHSSNRNLGARQRKKRRVSLSRARVHKKIGSSSMSIVCISWTSLLIYSML